MSAKPLTLVREETRSQPRRVLVVDDDLDFADGLAAVLELGGYAVEVAHSIASAEAKAGEFEPDMAILDICLGPENGIDLLNSLLSAHDRLLCIMATANAETETAIRAVKSGAYDYLRKPLHAEEVLAVLARGDDALRLRENKEAAEEAARRERGLLFDAIESIADGFALFDSDDRLVLHNQRLESILNCATALLVPGTPFEEIVRMVALQGTIQSAEGRIEEYVEERMERHRNPRGAFEIEVGDGRLLRVEERVTADGGRVSLYSDVTARRNLEETLVESESRFKDMVANVPGVVFQMTVRDGEGASFEYISPSASAILGLDPETVLADPSRWFDLVHPEDRPVFDASLARAARELRPWTWEGRMVLGNSGALWCQGAARPKQLANGGVLWNGIILDVTERKELEEQLLQTQRMKVVGQLSGGIAHEFNNLMLAAILNIENAREGGAETDNSLETALRSLASAKELTQRLLAFSRQQPLNPRSTDINELVSETVDLTRRMIGADISVTMEPENNLGAAMVDPRQLENALINLFLNARDAISAGGALTVSTRAVAFDKDQAKSLEDVAPGDYVTISVSDTGAGMPPGIAERAFEPFFTTKDVGEGSGLGLSMVYGFAKQSGGHVSLDSTPGKGTTVALYLPCGEAETTRQPKAKKEEKRDLPRGHETVLVVEDEPSVRAVVVSLLTKLGYTVIEAEDGPEALERLDETGEIDMLFTDIVLPGGMTGEDVADEVVKRQPGVRLLYTSGYAAAAMDEGGRVAQGAELLSKPYAMKVLAGRIREILDRDEV